jgi:hypothetical protein
MSGGNLIWANAWIRLACKQVRERKYSKIRTVTRDQLTRVFAALREGRTLTECYGIKDGRYIGGKIADVGALNRYMRTHPRVKKQIKALALVNRRAVMQGVADRKRLIAAPALLRNDGADAYEAIMAAAADLWEGERDDVISLMFVAAAEGKLDPRHASKRLPEFVKQHRQSFGIYRREGLAPDSLDRMLFDDGNTSLGDTITTGLWQ